MYHLNSHLQVRREKKVSKMFTKSRAPLSAAAALYPLYTRRIEASHLFLARWTEEFLWVDQVAKWEKNHQLSSVQGGN